MSRRRRSAQNESSPNYQAKRRELLQDAAIVFQEKGYEAATLNDIAERFGTDRASIYYYFASKKELFQALFHDVVSGVLDENIKAAEAVLALDLPPPRNFVDWWNSSYCRTRTTIHMSTCTSRKTWQSSSSSRRPGLKTCSG